MNSFKIFGKIGNKFEFNTELFENTLRRGMGGLAFYAVLGEFSAKNEIFINYFLNYFSKTQYWYTGSEPYTYKASPEETDEETAGIWLLPVPFTKTNQNEGNGDNWEDVTIFLMNSKLCSKGHSYMQDNALVMVLTTYLSSVIIMNINDVFNEGILHTLRHSTDFARYELNEDQPFQKIIFFFQQWSAIKQGCLDYSPGIHCDRRDMRGNLLMNVDINFKSDFLDPHYDHSIKEMSVREGIDKGFEEVIACLSEYRLDDTELSFDEEMGSHPRGLYYPWKVIRSICDVERITVKKIEGKYSTRDYYFYQKGLEKLKDFVDSFVIPSSVSPAVLYHSFFNQMAVNSAIDYYYYKMRDYFMKRQYIEYEDYQSDAAEEALEIFNSFKLIGGKAFEKRTVGSFWKNLSENQAHFQVMRERKPLNSTLRLDEVMKSYDIIEKLGKNFKHLKSETKLMKNNFETKLQGVVSDVSDIKQQLDEIKELLRQRAKKEG